MKTGTPTLLILGAAQRAQATKDPNTGLASWSVLGLSRIIPSVIYPIPLSSVQMVMAIRTPVPASPQIVHVVNQAGIDLGSLVFQTAMDPDDGEILRRAMRLAEPEGWSFQVCSIEDSNIIIPESGRVFFRSGSPDGDVIGSFDFVLLKVLPMSSERVAAIRADPFASKAVRMEIGCRLCSSKMRIYAALERDGAQEGAGWTWHQQCPDFFTCECGGARINLSSIRCNLHGLLGSRARHDGKVELVPLYHAASVRSTRSTFLELLEIQPREEIIQEFIEKNPILLHQFPAILLIAKPPILNRFRADFAILTPQKELVLIEIECAQTRLIKSDGGTAAPLSHAIDQVQDWLRVFSEHRLAVLDSLGIASDDVARFRGVVIAGRDKSCLESKLRALKAKDFGVISLLTYDDILGSMDALAEKMEGLPHTQRVEEG